MSNFTSFTSFTSLDIFSGIDNKITISGGINARIKSGLSVKTSSSITELPKRLQRTPEEMVRILDEVLREAINANVWSTRNGVDDIIDSGKLLNSQSLVYSGSSIQIRYSAPYAALIHYGGYIVPYGNVLARPVYIPPRPWVADVLSGQFGGIDLGVIYGDIIRRVLSRI